MLTAKYERLGLQQGDKVLDLGCGFGRHAFEAARRGASVVALDAGRDEVNGVAAMFLAMVEAGELAELAEGSIHANVVQGDALHLPFPDGAFDRVICSEVLEHVPDDLSAMRELARVLRPGGTMAITVPRFGPELVNWALSDEYHNVPGGHIRIYRRSVLAQRLTSTGMVVTGHHYAHGLHSPYWWLKCYVGTTNDEHPLVKRYHQLLVWDIMKKPALTRYAEQVLSPLMGKSVVLYLKKPQ
jgi:ubiquinone/menaquinone biosynthesis C-methylase UbiE